MKSLLVCSFLALALFSGVAHAQEAPLTVDADEVIYDQAAQSIEATGNVRLRYRGIRLFADHAVFDLQREVLTARGHVVLIDAQGREMHGDELVYDVRLELAEMRNAETIVNRVFLRTEQLAARPQRISATEAMLTTCDPSNPAVRVTAREIEVYPGDRLIARRATLWVGRYRVLTLPVLRVSLRSSEETARSFPRLGYNVTDGFWVEYIYGYDLGPLPSALYTKYGTRTGLIVRNTVSYRRPPFSLDFTLGRNQDKDMKIFDQGEAVLSLSEKRAGSLPIFYTASVRSGWFDESSTGIRTSRTMYAIGMRTGDVVLGPHTTAQVWLARSEAVYGTGGRQGVFRAGLTARHNLQSQQALVLAYELLDVSGATPFAFDAIAVEDRVNRVSFQYVRTGTRGIASTGFNTGLGYNFRDATTSVILGYGERVPDRYHWGVNAEYNLNTTDTKLTVDAGHSLGRGTYGTVQAIYHILTRAYEDLDFIITSRLCSCVDISLKYRQVRQEIWLEVGLAAFPETRLQLQFPRPP